jgi:hypothetical protein
MTTSNVEYVAGSNFFGLFFTVKYEGFRLNKNGEIEKAILRQSALEIKTGSSRYTIFALCLSVDTIAKLFYLQSSFR